MHNNFSVRHFSLPLAAQSLCRTRIVPFYPQSRVSLRATAYIYIYLSLHVYIILCAGLPRRPPLSLCRMPCFPLSPLPSISVTLLYRCTARRLSRAGLEGEECRTRLPSRYAARARLSAPIPILGISNCRRTTLFSRWHSFKRVLTSEFAISILSLFYPRLTRNFYILLCSRTFICVHFYLVSVCMKDPLFLASFLSAAPLDLRPPSTLPFKMSISFLNPPLFSILLYVFVVLFYSSFFTSNFHTLARALSRLVPFLRTQGIRALGP